MAQRTAASKTAWMMRGAGGLVQTIPPSAVKPADAEVSSEANFQVLCSYNWQKDGRTIFVPGISHSFCTFSYSLMPLLGGPPKWAPPALPVTLARDSGFQFVDQNAFRVPRYPFEPVFQALSIMNPNIRLDETDIIVNRNSLRKLLDFAAEKRQDPFRMDLHMVKDTLFISRKEKKDRLMIHGSRNTGYGHSLEDVFTKPEEGLETSSSHHRVICYDLGHLKCVVRFEVDAYYEDPDNSTSTDTPPQPVENITTLMADLDVNAPPPSSTRKGATMVTRRGTPISPLKLAEIKAYKTEKISASTPQLWFGRTPYLLTGQHDKGVVHSIRCTNVGMQFKEWEAANQDKLRKLVSLLVELKSIVHEIKGRAAILVCKDRGAPLQIFKAKDQTSVLPKNILVKHWDLGTGENSKETIQKSSA
jgi:hypothetical protein